jgi:hypothetical protein
MKPAALFFIAVLFPYAAFSDEIAPPEWLWGAWRMEYEGEVMVLVFQEKDIIMNGESARAMAEDGYITSFRQNVDNNVYSIRVDYADGFWWQETFPRTVMNSVYADKSLEQGKTEALEYVRVKTPAGQSGTETAPDELAAALKKLDPQNRVFVLKFIEFLARSN